MGFNLSEIARKDIISLKPYSSARDEFTGKAEVYLDANENPYDTGYNRYPDPFQMEVKKAIEKIKRVPPSQCILGNGSDEIIDLLIRSFCDPGKDNILLLPPTYGMYKVYADINQVKCNDVSLNKDFDINENALLSAVDNNTKIVFLCSPNNPSGNLLSPEKVKRILQEFSGLVVVDEAYIDFSGSESWSEFLDLYPNLFVMQTLSKAWGLAGIRLGIGFANKEVIDLLNKVKPPYNISQLTQEKALEALTREEEKNNIVQNILMERLRLCEELEKIEQVQKVYPSDANFVLVRVPQAQSIYNELVEKSIIVRDRSKVLLCDDCLRITVGKPNENKALLSALQELLNK